MSYQRHNFKPREVLAAKDLNEMDSQIAENTEKVGNEELETVAKTLSGAVNELNDSAINITDTGLGIIIRTGEEMHAS